MSTAKANKVSRTDPEAVMAALKRARIRAEEIAAATGTAIVQWENGRVVRVYPQVPARDKPRQ